MCGRRPGARDAVLGEVDGGGRLVRALVDAVDRARVPGHRPVRVERGDRATRTTIGARLRPRLRRLEDVDRAEHVDARAERRVGAAERHLQRGEVDHVRDAVLVDRALERGEVGDVARDVRDRRDRVRVEQQAQPPRLGREVERDDRPAVGDELGRRPTRRCSRTRR